MMLRHDPLLDEKGQRAYDVRRTAADTNQQQQP